MTAQKPHHVAVIGCGLAGGAVAVALAKRGWQISLFERGAAIASGASALPIGMLSRHHTANPTPLSRLTAIGLPITVSHLQTYLPSGEGWQKTTIENHRASAPDQRPQIEGVDTAYMIEPARLIEAWLTHVQAITTTAIHPYTPIEALCFDTDERVWQLIGADGTVVCRCTHVVVANAHEAPVLLKMDALGLRPVGGQVTLGPASEADHASPALPAKRLSGVYVPQFRTRAGSFWSAGATYRRGNASQAIRMTDRDANRCLLESIAPEALPRWARQAEAGELWDWVGVRCASVDRLPLVGGLPFGVSSPVDPSTLRAAIPVADGLFGLLALGSRGLSLAPLLGETLACEMAGEPSPLPQDLRLAIEPRRALLQTARQALKARQ